MSVVLYGCETWSVTFRAKYRMGVFENGVLKGIFGPKWDEVTGEWRNLRNEELNSLYASTNIIVMNKSRIIRKTGHVARMEYASSRRVFCGHLRELDH